MTVVIGVALLGALGSIPTTVSCASTTTFLAGETTSASSTVTTTAALLTQRTNTVTERVYDISPADWEYNTFPNLYGYHPYVVFPPNTYAYEDADLIEGMNVSVSWVANATVSVYILNAAQNSVYASSNATVTTPNIASAPDSPKVGSLGFRVPANDTYFLIIFDPNNGTKGLQQSWVELDNATGTATFDAARTAIITETTTTVVLVPQQVTSDQTSTSSYRRTANLLSQLGGTACSG